MNKGPWRVLHVITNHEKRVAQYLNARSVEHYLPLYHERSRWSDRIVNLERPLFTGYVFARFAPQERLSVIATPGVVQLLGETERDTVSEIEIVRIREGLTGGCILRPHRGLAVGNLVRVLRGVFEGAEGVVTQLRQQCKVVMALSATMQCFSLEVDLENIEILRKQPDREIPGYVRQLELRGT